MNESFQRKSGAILSYVSIGINTLIQLLYTPLLIRMLGQSEYGLYSLVASIIGYLTVLDLGFGNAIIVYTAKYKAQGKDEEEKKLHGMFKIIFIIIGIIAALLGIILYFLVENIFGSTMTDIEIHKMKIMMLILSFNLMITFSFHIYSSIISAYEKFTFQKIMSILNSILKPIIMIPLLFMGYKSIAMSIVITIVNVIVCVSNYIYCRKKIKITSKFSGFDKSLFKTIFSYSIWIFLGVIADKVNWSVDNFVLGSISGTIAVSIYSIGSTLNQLFINLSTAVSSVMLPKMSKMVAKNASNEELTNEFIKVGRIQYLIIFLMASGLVLIGKNFILMWAGEGFEESYRVALLLILPLSIPLIQNLGLSITQAMNKHRFRNILMCAMSVINIIITIFLAKRFGATGAAAGTAISLVAVNVITMNIYYFKVIKIDIPEFWKNIILMTMPFIIPIIIEIIFIRLTQFKGVYNLIIYGGTYTCMYCVVAYFFAMNNYEKNVVNNVFKKLHFKK